MKKSKEQWEKIKDFENYEISNRGEIRLLDYSIIDKFGKKRKYKGHLLKQAVNSSNYKKVSLRKNGQNYNKYVHRLLAETFIPNPNFLPCVNHKDGNKWNNNLDNLEWCNEEENTLHAHQNGLASISNYNKYRVGQTTRRFDLIEVEEIKELYNQGYTQKEIAEKFNCYDSTINNIVNNKLYKAIEPDTIELLEQTISILNNLREQWLIEEDKNKKQLIWKAIINLLPESWLQTRTWTANYAVLRNIIHWRKGHKLSEWSQFINWVSTLPYANELLLFEN